MALVDMVVLVLGIHVDVENRGAHNTEVDEDEEGGTSDAPTGTQIEALEEHNKCVPTCGKDCVLGFVYVLDWVAHDVRRSGPWPRIRRAYCWDCVQVALLPRYCSTLALFCSGVRKREDGTVTSFCTRYQARGGIGW